MDILFVVLALDVLDLGEGWVGYLNAAFAAGGMIGGLAAVTLVGRRYLAPPIALGALACGGAVRRHRACGRRRPPRSCSSR